MLINHDLFTSFNAMPYSTEKCQWFQFEHPFTYMVAGMTGSGKMVWVQSLFKQAYVTGRGREKTKLYT